MHHGERSGSASAEKVIALRAVSKSYRLYNSTLHRLKDLALRQKTHRDHWSLRGIDLDIAAGETVAILGANGAGKSTLLRLIARVSKPTGGQIDVHGRISALLELGAGFHPDWTGRQNAEFHARIHGVPARAIDACLSAIETFADIGSYFDQPLRTYSTGMHLRVAFASAVQVNPDILIVDEALAVGDAPFQFKCFQRIREFQERGTAILLVTHNLELVQQLCSRGIVLHDGNIWFDGPPAEATHRYVKILFPDSSQHRLQSAPKQLAGGATADFPVASNGRAQIISVAASDERGSPTNTFGSGQTARFAIQIRCNVDIDRPVISFALSTVEGFTIYGISSEMIGTTLAAAKAGEIIGIDVVCRLNLPAGSVFVIVYISDSSGPSLLDGKVPAIELTIAQGPQMVGVVDLAAQMSEQPRLNARENIVPMT